MAKKTTPTAFEVCVEAPATPDFVVRTAQFVAAMLQAAGQSNTDPGITMEVFNYNTRVVVHPRSKAGRQAATKVLRFVADPVSTSRKNSREAQQLAQAFTDHRRLIVDRKTQVVVPGSKGVTTTPIDKPFIESVKGLADGQLPDVIMPPLSETEEITQVLRVGRSSMNAEMTARVVVNGEPCDLPFDAECKAMLFALAESEKLARVRLEVVFDPDGSGHVLSKLSRILQVSAFEEMTGAEFLQRFEQLADSGCPIFSRPIEDIVADLEDRW